MAEETQWQEYEAAGHLELTVREQREINAGTQSLSSFYSVKDPDCGTARI